MLFEFDRAQGMVKNTVLNYTRRHVEERWRREGADVSVRQGWAGLAGLGV